MCCTLPVNNCVKANYISFFSFYDMLVFVFVFC